MAAPLEVRDLEQTFTRRGLDPQPFRARVPATHHPSPRFTAPGGVNRAVASSGHTQSFHRSTTRIGRRTTRSPDAGPSIQGRPRARSAIQPERHRASSLQPVYRRHAPFRSVIHRDSPLPSAMRPSSDVANFSVMKGRPFGHRRRRSRGAGDDTPPRAHPPRPSDAGSSQLGRKPRPATLRVRIAHAGDDATERPRFDASPSVQGPVRPVKLNTVRGSRQSRRRAARALPVTCARRPRNRVASSACAPPGGLRLCAPLAENPVAPIHDHGAHARIGKGQRRVLSASDTEGPRRIIDSSFGVAVDPLRPTQSSTSSSVSTNSSPAPRATQHFAALAPRRSSAKNAS